MKRKKNRGKNGKSVILPVGLRCVPLAITRLERNIFSGLFPASLISNYESETTRWAAALGSPPLPPFHPTPVVPFIHPLFPRPFLRLLESHPKARASSNLPRLPFLLSGPCYAAPREFFASLLLYDLTFLQFAISRPIPLSSFSFSSALREERYIFMIDIYISLYWRAEM